MPPTALTRTPAAAVRAVLADAGEAFAANTQRAIRADTDDFIAWCHAAGHAALPAGPATLCAYLDALAVRVNPRTRKPLAYATLARRLASLAWLHRVHNLPDPTRAPEVRLKLKALARRKGTRQAQAQGLGREALDAVLAALGDDPALETLRDAALLTVAYDALLRRSELVALRLEDIRRAADGSGLLYLSRSKTDPEGQGVYRWLAPDTVDRLETWRAARDAALHAARNAVRREHTALVRAVAQGTAVNAKRRQAALVRRLQRLERAAEHLWLQIGAGGAVLGPLAVAGPDPGRRVPEIVKRRAQAAGLDPAAFSGHSTRVGAAQDLTAAGFGLPAIQQAGGWTSPAMPARYAEKLLPRQGAMAQLATRQGRR